MAQAVQQKEFFNRLQTVHNHSLRINTSPIEWNGSRDHAIITLLDVTKDHKEKEWLEILAETDAVTGVLNRRGGMLALERLGKSNDSVNITLI